MHFHHEELTMPIGANGTDGKGYKASSVTSNTIGTGSKTFVTQSNLAYSAGARVRFSNSAYPTQYMEGIVTSYTVTTIVATIDNTSGSGTISSWNINLAGDKGTGGGTGLTGATGAAGTNGTNGTNGSNGADGVDGKGYKASSTTSVLIGTGSKSFATTEASQTLAYTIGARARATNPVSGAYIEGVVTDYTGNTLTIDVDATSGAGTYGAWNINVAGEIGMANAWLLTGNAGTVAGTNFIGTTDNVAFVVKTNNTQRVKVLGSGTVAIGHTLDADIDTDAALDILGALRFASKNNSARTLFYHSTNISGTPDADVNGYGDGFRLRFDPSYFASNVDGYIFEKVDANHNDPDSGLDTGGGAAPPNTSGIAFCMTGADGVVEPLLTLKGDNKVGIGQAAATVLTARLDIAAATASGRDSVGQIRLRAGSTPATLNDGDIWFETSGLKIRIGGVTKSVTVA